RAPGAFGSAQVPPSPPPPSSTNQESPSKGSAAPSPSKTVALTEYQAWTMTDIRLRPSISLTPADLETDEDMAPNEQAQSSDDEDIRSAHIPTVNLRQGWWKPFEEEQPATPEPAWLIRSSDVPVLTNNWASALASNYSPPPKDSLLVQTGDISTCMDWFCKRRGITELKPQYLEGPAYEIIKVFHPDSLWMDFLGWWMTVEVVKVGLGLIQKLQEPLKHRRDPLVEEEVADEMEPQLCVVFMSFVGFSFPHALVKDIFHVSLRSPIRCIIMASVLLCCGACGGGNVVVVVVVVMSVVVALNY
nr:hypothetical protein [Tanacetum cinerariifolium]